MTSFWSHFTLKKTIWRSQKAPATNYQIKAIFALTHVPGSAMFYLCVPAAGNWWQPKQTSKSHGKERGEEKIMLADTCNKICQQLLDQDSGKKWVSQRWPVFDHILQWRRLFEVHKRPPLQTNVPCSSIFYLCVPAADIWWQPKQASKNHGKERGEEKLMPADTCKKYMSTTFRSKNCGKKWFCQIPEFLAVLD